jgi:hypothetical protein
VWSAELIFKDFVVRQNIFQCLIVLKLKKFGKHCIRVIQLVLLFYFFDEFVVAVDTLVGHDEVRDGHDEAWQRDRERVEQVSVNFPQIEIDDDEIGIGPRHETRENRSHRAVQGNEVGAVHFWRISATLKEKENVNKCKYNLEIKCALFLKESNDKFQFSIRNYKIFRF